MPAALLIVLASGRGRRLGGPKALLRWPPDDQPLALAHARAGHAARTVIVTRADIAAALAPITHAAGDFDVVISTAPDEQGPAGSLSAAAPTLAALPADAAVLVTPVDCPPVPAAVVAALTAGLTPQLAGVRPRYAGRGGHPVLLRAGLLVAHYASPTDPPPLRDVLRGRDDIGEIALDDDSIRVDIDTPDDFAAWCRRIGQPERLPSFWQTND